MIIVIGLFSCFNSAILCHEDRRGVWFRVLYDVLRTRSTFRDEDSLWDKGMICDYVDRAWLIVLLVNERDII